MKKCSYMPEVEYMSSTDFCKLIDRFCIIYDEVTISSYLLPDNSVAHFLRGKTMTGNFATHAGVVIQY